MVKHGQPVTQKQILSELLKLIQGSKQVPEFLTALQVADILQVSPRTLHRFRMTGRGPIGVMVGGQLRYQRVAFEQYISQLPEFGNSAGVPDETASEQPVEVANEATTNG